jgi:hypothetical protein
VTKRELEKADFGKPSAEELRQVLIDRLRAKNDNEEEGGGELGHFLRRNRKDEETVEGLMTLVSGSLFQASFREQWAYESDAERWPGRSLSVSFKETVKHVLAALSLEAQNYLDYQQSPLFEKAGLAEPEVQMIHYLALILGRFLNERPFNWKL